MDYDIYKRMSVAELTALTGMLQSIIMDKDKELRSRLRCEMTKVDSLEKELKEIDLDTSILIV